MNEYYTQITGIKMSLIHSGNILKFRIVMLFKHILQFRYDEIYSNNDQTYLEGSGAEMLWCMCKSFFLHVYSDIYS